MADPGTVADRYELGPLLGRGGMADVHRAHDRLLHRDVAVKVLRETTTDEHARARFTAETHTLARLSHSGLVMVLDAGTDRDRPFLVMELVEGQTLGDLVARGPVADELVGAIGVQLAEALAYAHAEGVVHRDVKPANVLLGADDRVKLADFGIARLLGDTVRHTQTGTAVGTAAYLAPEQVTGQEITPATDVYALGLVLLEALTGERAYPGSLVEAAHARLHRQPEIPAGLAPRWQELLSAMTERDPVRRPTAAQVASALRDQPTARIPTAISAPADLGEDGPASDQPTVVSRIDEAGDRIARAAVDGVATLRALPAHQKGVAGAVGALVALVVIVALAAGGGPDVGDPADPAAVPEDTPAQLRVPLQDLHDAVEGR